MDRQAVKLRVHRAFLLGGTDEECFFVNVFNASANRTITVTHVWLETGPPIHADDGGLPITLPPERQWETAFPISVVPQDSHARALVLARAKLSTGTVIRSVPR